jgi:hypothetical protein
VSKPIDGWKINLVQEVGCLSNIAGIWSSDSRVVRLVVGFEREKRKAGEPFIAPSSISKLHISNFLMRPRLSFPLPAHHDIVSRGQQLP